MSGGIKLLLILGAVALGGMLLIGAGGWYWWKFHGSEFLESGAAAMAEGQAAGRGLDESGCVAIALERHRKEGADSMTAAVRINLWLSACLGEARIVEKFCDNVPSYDSPLAVGTWAGLTCVQQGFSDPHCGNLYSGVAKHCDSPRRQGRLKGNRKG